MSDEYSPDELARLTVDDLITLRSYAWERARSYRRDAAQWDARAADITAEEIRRAKERAELIVLEDGNA